MKARREEPNAEKISSNKDDPTSRFPGSNSIVKIFSKDTPGQIVKRVVREQRGKEQRC